jgi:GNAT superfamily N-acetyltransferase
MADPQYRPATDGDADALAAVYRSAYRQNRELGFPAKAESATAEQVAGWIADHRVHVATVDGAVVAGVRLEETDPGRVKLSRLAVLEDHKGDGIGSGLLAHAEDAARELGAGTLWLTTPPEHPFLPGFYRDRGYERVGEYPLAYRDYDEAVFEKPL